VGLDFIIILIFIFLFKFIAKKIEDEAVYLVLAKDGAIFLGVVPETVAKKRGCVTFFGAFLAASFLRCFVFLGIISLVK